MIFCKIKASVEYRLFDFFLNVLIFQLAREVLDIAAGMIKAGVTTEEIDHAVHLVRTLLFYSKSFKNSFYNVQSNFIKRI